jgi:two-component system nitrate/nitrite sensor histidine kinase NarX
MFHRLRRGAGLRAKIIAYVLIPTAIILAAVGGLAFYASQRVTEDLVFDRNRDRTRLLADQLSADLEAYIQPLRTLDVTIGASRSAYYQQALLEDRWLPDDLGVFDAGILILDQDGMVVAAMPNPTALVGQNLPQLIAEPGMVLEEDLALTDILFDRIGGKDVIALRYPLGSVQGDLQGTLVGLFHTERGATRSSIFYRNIWDLYIGRREVAYLVDGAGRVIFHPDTFFIGEDFSHLAAVQRALNGERGAVRARDVEGRDVVAGFAPVPRTSWGLVTEDLWSEITQTSRSYTRLMVGLLALGVIVPVAVVTLGVRRITRPIADLTRAAEEIAGGNFSQTIDVRTGDELEMLAEQFNSMAAQLEASYAHLEQRVADRTRELATLNAVAAVVSRSLDLEEIMDAALRKTLDTMGMEAGAAFRLEGKDVLSLMAHAGLSDSFLRQVSHLPLKQSLAAQALYHAAPVVRPVEDYPDGALKAALRREGLRSVISVPLVAKEEMLGVLNLATREPRGITPEERSLLASIGQQTGVAVENARLYDQAEASAAAAERSRLARELHDAVSQTLFSASMIADVLPRLWERDPEEARRRLDTLRRLTRGAMAEMRTLLWELRPAALLNADMDELLDQLGKAVASRAVVEVELDAEAIPGLPPDVKLALYRIAQEALNNVVKHANASRLTLSLHQTGEEVALRICDDGRGFDFTDVRQGHFGLGNMAERAEAIGATLTVESETGRGTTVVVLWRQAGEPSAA